MAGHMRKSVNDRIESGKHRFSVVGVLVLETL